ncbi:hypothetical protein F5882DRAFT_390870 [Hyaloscypha sp. PMI_1271]|nr:hypothetical protein F5882DRAFT_390870 [Hyaloscypha sp. PMI_1271]
MIYYFHFLATWGWFRRPILPTLMYSISCINLLRIWRVPIILQASFKLTTPAFPESQIFSCSPPVPPSLYPHALFGTSPTQESLHLGSPRKSHHRFLRTRLLPLLGTRQILAKTQRAILQYQIRNPGFTLLLHNDKNELTSERIRDQLGDTVFAELYLPVETWAMKYSTSVELRNLWIQFSCAVAATIPDEIGQQPVYKLPFGDLDSYCFENWLQMLLRSRSR